MEIIVNDLIFIFFFQTEYLVPLTLYTKLIYKNTSEIKKLDQIPILNKKNNRVNSK